jgi:hypothetical protein
VQPGVKPDMSTETLKGFNKKRIAISASLRWRSLWEITKKKKPFIRFAHYGLYFFILLIKASFQRNEKTKPSRYRGKAFSFWVEDGIVSPHFVII